MIYITDKKVAAGTRPLHLSVAFEAEIHVPLHEHLGIDGAVRVVANRATLAQCRVLKDVRSCLFTMTSGTTLIEARHGQSPGGFQNVHPVRVVALDAIHLAFENRVMLRQVKFHARFLVALEAGFGVFTWIDDEFFETAAAGHGDVLAPRAVAGFTAVLAGCAGICQSQPRVRTRGEYATDIRMAVHASLVPDVSGSLDLQWDNHCSIGGTGI